MTGEDRLGTQAKLNKEPSAMLRLAPTFTAAFALAATPAAAQSLVESFARSTAESLIMGALNKAAAAPPAQNPPASPRGAQAAAAPAAPRAVTRVRDLPQPPDLAEQKKALDEFSRYRCSDCEGGWGYDSWPRHGLNMVGNDMLEKTIGSLAVGQSVSWKGGVANGQGIVVAEVEKSGFPCKEVTWRMTKGKETAERPGLFCYGKASQYSGSDSWVEVY